MKSQARKIHYRLNNNRSWLGFHNYERWLRRYQSIILSSKNSYRSLRAQAIQKVAYRNLRRLPKKLTHQLFKIGMKIRLQSPHRSLIPLNPHRVKTSKIWAANNLNVDSVTNWNHCKVMKKININFNHWVKWIKN